MTVWLERRGKDRHKEKTCHTSSLGHEEVSWTPSLSKFHYGGFGHSGKGMIDCSVYNFEECKTKKNIVTGRFGRGKHHVSDVAQWLDFNVVYLRTDHRIM